MSAPVIFCHYGNSEYLEPVFRAIRLYNAEKRIVLLGDDSNIHTAKKENIEHCFFSDFENTEEIQTFNNIYRHIAGVKHGRPKWTNFVFKRWFYVHAFLKQQKTESFWHFDSDNLILAPLKDSEAFFGQYDCTEQCGGSCINGYISSFDIIDGYVKKINSLFHDRAFLERQQAEMAENPRFAFTEMRAYQQYKLHSRFNTIRLNTIVNGTTFDDCICQDNGMEMYEKPLGSHFLKKLYYTDGGVFFCRQKETGEFIKMNSINMSWVPFYLYDKIMQVACPPKQRYSGHGGPLKILDIYNEPVTNKINTLIIQTRNDFRRFAVSWRDRLRSKFL